MIIVSSLAVLALGLLAVPRVRKEITRRILPLIAEVIPRLVTVAQRPLKLLEGIGGILLLNLAYIAVLFACIAAFDGSLNIALVAVVSATIVLSAPVVVPLSVLTAAIVLVAPITASIVESLVA